MSKVGKIARRSFLVGSAAIAGGVAFGAYMVARDPENPLTKGASPDDAIFNPWIKINAQGITLIAPHADVGQGAASVQAALIAEELDLDPGQFDLSFGRPSPAYYNTALADEAVPFLSTDTSLPARSLRQVMGAAVKLMGLQITGGSSTVPDSFDKLRAAGASARETLKLAAARQTGLAVDQLTTKSGAVILPDGSALPYRDLAAAAAQISPVQDVPLRDPSQWRLLGKPMQRIDIVPKSTGTQTYGIDIDLPDMLYAAVRLNPHRGGAVLDHDDGAARAMRGVQHILPVTGGIAVVADNTWRAFQAAEALEITWGKASYPDAQEDHWAAVEAAFHPDHLDKVWRDEGAPLAQPPGPSASYRAPYVAHQPLEPLTATVRVDDTGVDVWTGHQFPRLMAQRIARLTGVEQDQVRLHAQMIGGSFGHRLEFLNTDLAAEIAAQIPGRPVKLTFRREEDFAQDFPRQIGMAKGRGSVAGGQVTGFELEIATVSASRSQMQRAEQPLPGPDAQIVAGAWNQPYDIPSLHVAGYAVPELYPTSSWRSVGASTAGFFYESLLDELIHAAGADPMAERIRLCNDPVARAVLTEAARISDWATPLPQGRGRGVALVRSFGVPVAQVIDVSAAADGIRIDRVCVVTDGGPVLDPVNFENNVAGGVIWGLGHAINSEITISDGRAEQANYYDSEGMRMAGCPEIIVRPLQNATKIRGIGEPPVPPAAPALANAIFAATGTRLREMPFGRFMEFAV